MKKFDDEKHIVVKTPDEKVIKGYPEAELKWMFGSKKIVVPKVVRIFLYHGWKKWREEAKADLKKELLQNVDLGREYMMRRQERIILDSDRIMSRTVYDKEKNRWEMDPIAVPFAVSKKLVEYARIRQDSTEMFVTLKGDDKEYRVDIKVMWIPFSERNLYPYVRQLGNLAPLIYQLFHDASLISYFAAKELFPQMIKKTYEDLLVMVALPVVEFVLPNPLKLGLGIATGEELYQSERYSFWKFEMQHGFETRSKSRFWIPWLLFTAYIYRRVVTVVSCVILFVVLQLIPGMIRNFPRLGFKFGDIEPVFRSANLRKLGRLEW